MDPQPRRRRRIARSCIECRRRKIKCDRKDPCTHCVATQLRCIYRGHSDQPSALLQPTSSINSPTPLASLHTRQVGVSPLSDNNALQAPHNPATRATTPTATTQIEFPIPPNQDDLRLSARVQNSEASFADILNRIRSLEQSLAQKRTDGLSETTREILGRPSRIESSEWIFSKTRIMRWSLWMGTSKEFDPFLACYAEATGKGTGDSFQAPEVQIILGQVGELLKECKGIARSMKFWRPSRSLSNPQLYLAAPSRVMADAMASLYVQFFESTHRILHIPSFWTDYHKFWNNPENAPTELRLKILLVVGIGSSLHKEITNIRFRHTVHCWVYAAQSWLSGPLEKDRLSISALQIDCLTILARQIFSIGADLVWTSMGTLVHKAMQINLHRDPKQLSGISVLQAEIRRRLWATIVEMTTQAALDSAMPATIPESDTEAPSNINDDEIDEFTAVVQPHSKDIYTNTSLQLLLLDSLPIRLRILHILTSLSSEISYLNVIALSSELTEASSSYYKFLKENASSIITSFHRNLLDYLVRRFMIPLHCPFTSKARTNPLLSSSLKASLDAAMAIMSPEPDEGFSRLMATGGGLFREGIWCAMTVISIELLAQVESQRVDGTLHRNSGYIGLLKQIVKDFVSFSAERIRQGETNIKCHMFLSMIIAQVEAKQSGADCELRIAQSANDSLEFCHGLLLALAGTVPLADSNDDGLGPMISLDGESREAGSGFDLDLDWDFLLPDAGV